MFCLLQIAVHYQKSLKIQRKILFPKTRFGSRNRPCQHKWFGIYPWLHYDIEKDCLFCFYCMKNISKPTAEKNKEPTLHRSDLKIGKRHPSVLKITKTVNITKKQQSWQLSCVDPLIVMNQKLAKSRVEERKYLKVVIECIQYLARQGMPIRGSDHINDHLIQLLILRGKGNCFGKNFFYFSL